MGTIMQSTWSRVTGQGYRVMQVMRVMRVVRGTLLALPL